MNKLHYNNQHLNKKPRLDIARQSSQASPGRTANQTKKNSSEDMYDLFWGADLGAAELEKIEFDEIQALSQMTIKASQAPKPTPPTQLPQKTTPVNGARYSSPKVPLRRAASSNWPANRDPSESKRFKPLSVAEKTIKNVNEDDALQQMINENKMLKEQLTKKNGEVHLIRDRLKSVQQELDKQKRGYTEKITAMQVERDNNVSELSKEIKNLKGELEVKTMEMKTAERRTQHVYSAGRTNPDSPKSGRSTPGPSSLPKGSSPQGLNDDQLMCRIGLMRARSYTYSLDFIKQIITPELMKPCQPVLEDTVHKPSSISLPVNQKLSDCQPSTSSGRTSSNKPSISGCQQRATYQSVRIPPSIQQELIVPCPSSEPCNLSLLSPTLLDINSENARQVISQVTESCAQTLVKTHQCLMASLSRKRRRLHIEKKTPAFALSSWNITDLLCHKELFKNEKCICIRRTLALQALLIDFSGFAAELILPDGSTQEEMLDTVDSDTHNMLIVIRAIVRCIKKHKTHLYDGLLAAVMVLLKSLMKTDIILPEQSQNLVGHVLLGVVFSRPGGLVLYFILQLLVAGTKYPYFTSSLCQNSGKCILQVLCILIQLLETPKKHLLSDLFTCWVLTLFYGRDLNSPNWLFSGPSKSVCQCRRLVSRLSLTMLGEACSIFPTAELSDRPTLEKLLTRGVLLVSTLLYQDEHFGANVDPISEGHYEVFIWSMNNFAEDGQIKLDEGSRAILNSLSVQELELRQPNGPGRDDETTRVTSNNAIRTLLFEDIKDEDIRASLAS